LVENSGRPPFTDSDWRGLINRLRQGFEVTVLFQYVQDVTQLIQLGFRFFSVNWRCLIMELLALCVT
jgi:hypothetical protein